MQSSEKTIYLSDRIDKTKSENLNFIKFIAAFLVIYSHSFRICLKNGTSDIISQITSGYISFGAISVSLFLFVSGLLVTKSLMRSQTPKKYFGGRIIRIFPLLIVVILITAFVLGPIVTTLSLSEYFSDSLTYKYLSYIILIPSYLLPGVFVDNPTNIVNGPLWTVVLEMICYVLLFVAYKLKLLRKKSSTLITIGCFLGFLLLAYASLFDINIFSDYLRPMIIFFEGSLCYIFKDKLVLSFKLFILMILVGLFCLVYYLPDISLLICLPYVILYLSYTSVQCPHILSDLGIYSYGIYLTAYPVQQVLRLYIKNIGPVQNSVGTIVICLLLAILLNKTIEEPCIKWYKKKMEEK